MTTTSTIEYLNIPLYNRHPEITPETILFMNFENAIEDLTGNHPVITPVKLVSSPHNVTRTYGDSYTGKYSLRVHSRTGLQIPQSVDRDFRWGNLSYTFEFAFKALNTNLVSSIPVIGLHTSSTGIPQIYTSITNLLPDLSISVIGTSFGRISNMYDLNTWTHIKIVRHSHSTRVFKNGVPIAYGNVKNFDYNFDYNSFSTLLVIGSRETGNVNSTFDGYIDQIKITKPVKLMNIPFDSILLTGQNSPINEPRNKYYDNEKRHTFIEEGNVREWRYAAALSANSRFGLDATVGNIKSTGTSEDFILDRDFAISCYIDFQSGGAGAFWAIYDSSDVLQFSLKYSGGYLQVSNASVVLINSVFADTGYDIYELWRNNGKLYLFKGASLQGSCEYPDIINGSYIRIGGEGSGCGAYIDNFTLERG